MPCSFFRLHLCRCRAPGRKQFFLRLALEQVRLHRVAVALQVGLLKYLPNALERHRQRLEVLGLADRAQRNKTLFRIEQIIGARAKYRADLVVSKPSPFPENVARPIENEIEHLRFLCWTQSLLRRMSQ